MNVEKTQYLNCIVVYTNTINILISKGKLVMAVDDRAQWVLLCMAEIYAETQVGDD